MIKFTSIIITVSLVFLAILIPICQSNMSVDMEINQSALEHCCGLGMQNIIFSSNHLYFLEIISNSNTILLNFSSLLLVIFILIFAYLAFSQYKKYKNFFHNPYFTAVHMKPWDPLLYAFSQGIIHNKHLD